MNDCNSGITRDGVGEMGQSPASLVCNLITMLKKARSEGRLPNNLVLDYGCGRGRNIQPFLDAGFNVFAAEMSSTPHFQELIDEFDDKVTLISLGNDPLKDIRRLKEKFAAVVALASIHHDPNPIKVINLLQSITSLGGFHALFVFTKKSPFTKEAQPPWIKIGVPSLADKPYQLTVQSPFAPKELYDHYPQRKWKVWEYAEGIKLDDTQNKIGPCQYEPEHFHSFARILANKIC